MPKESLPRTWLEKGLFGNQLHMWCDICDREFVVKVGGLGSMLSSIAGSILSSQLGYTASRITDSVGRHMHSKEAMKVVKKTLHQCPQCGRWVCDNDWNSSAGKCKICTGEYKGTAVEPAQFEMLEKAATEAEKAFSAAATAAAASLASAAAFATGATTVTCPHCGQVTPIGKFCANCGKPLTVTCQNCGALLPYGVKHCPNCGAKIKY